MRAVRWIVFLISAGVFFGLAVTPEVYSLTSPYELPLHVLLRKTYSVIAFAIVGAAWTWAWPGPPAARVRVAILAIGSYSACIEVVQKLMGSNEGLIWNTVDTLCGALGGALGALALRFIRAFRAR